jgi:DNA-binding response OmpR family regulator
MTGQSPIQKPGKETILVIEDDRAIREGLAMNLRLEGYQVRTASDGDTGMRAAFNDRPDLILLDIMLPGWSGLNILEELRKRGEKVPVLILSARGATPDKVAGLDMGADDYMAKPFDLPELLARIQVMLRRQRSGKQDISKLSFGRITIDRAARTVEVRGRKVELSAREFDLLCLLAASPGQVFTRDTILQRIWGWDYEGTPRTVDNFVASLRKKIELGRRTTKHIKTLPGVGYKLDPETKP